MNAVHTLCTLRCLCTLRLSSHARPSEPSTQDAAIQTMLQDQCIACRRTNPRRESPISCSRNQYSGQRTADIVQQQTCSQHTSLACQWRARCNGLDGIGGAMPRSRKARAGRGMRALTYASERRAAPTHRHLLQFAILQPRGAREPTRRRLEGPLGGTVLQGQAARIALRSGEG